MCVAKVWGGGCTIVHSLYPANVEPMVVYCWPVAADVVPTLNQLDVESTSRSTRKH